MSDRDIAMQNDDVALLVNGDEEENNYRLEICNLAGDIQDSLVSFIRRVNDEEIGCMSRDIEVDGYMLIFHEQETWQKFVDVFDILGMDFTTGEPDGEFKTWYIDFEFSDGISE